MWLKKSEDKICFCYGFEFLKRTFFFPSIASVTIGNDVPLFTCKQLGRVYSAFTVGLANMCVGMV